MEKLPPAPLSLHDIIPVGMDDGFVISETVELNDTVLPDIIDPDEGVRLETVTSLPEPVPSILVP